MIRFISALLLAAPFLFAQAYYDSHDAWKIRGRAVAATAPTNGQTLVWNSSALRWEPSSGGSSLTAGGTGALSISGGVIDIVTSYVANLTGTNNWTGSNVCTGCSRSAPHKSGLLASIPATCTVADTYFATDAPAGANVYLCATTNTWTRTGNVGGAPALTTAGAVPFVTSAGVLTQDGTNFFWDSANTRLGIGTGSPSLGRIHVTNSTTDAGIYIQQSGEYRALNILANGPATSLGQAVVDSQTATTGGVLWVGASGTGFTNTSTGAAYFWVSQAAASGNVAMIRNAGTGVALNIKNDQNSRMVYLDSVNTTTDVVTGAFPSLTTASVFTVGTGSATYTNSNGMIRANVASSSATGNAFVADMSGSGTAFRANTSKGYGLDVQSSSTTTAAARIFTTAQNNNDALQIAVYTAPTGSGKALSVYGGVTAGSLNAWISSTGGAYFAGDITTAGIPRFNGTNTTGAGSALLGANSPAVTNTAPYTWIQIVTADGSTAYIPAWK